MGLASVENASAKKAGLADDATVLLTCQNVALKQG